MGCMWCIICVWLLVCISVKLLLEMMNSVEIFYMMLWLSSRV